MGRAIKGLALDLSLFSTLIGIEESGESHMSARDHTEQGFME